MARMRTVKPEFWTDSRMVALPMEARLFFIGLWNFADDAGLLEDDPLAIKMQVFPGDDIDILPLIEGLISKGRIHRATATDGTRLLVIRRFVRHQNPNRPTPSRWELTEDSVSAHGGLTEDSLSGENGQESPGQSQFTEDSLRTHCSLTAVVEGRGVEGRGSADESSVNAKEKRATVAPPRFDLDDSLRSWASTNAPRVTDLEIETERFLDHHRAKGTKFKDWTAAWRTWMRRGDGYAAEKPAPVKPGGTVYT